MSKTMYSLAEVAAELGVPQSDIRMLIADGAVRVQQVAGRFVFTTKDLEAVEAALDDADDGEDGEDEPDGADDDVEGDD